MFPFDISLWVDSSVHKTCSCVPLTSMKDLAVRSKLVIVMKEWFIRYMAENKGCGGQGGQEASLEGSKGRPYTGSLGDKNVHPCPPHSSLTLVPPGPQIWIEKSRRVTRKRGAMWQTSDDKLRKGHRTDCSSRGHWKLCPHFIQKESMFMQMHTRALFLARGRKATYTVKGRGPFSSILTSVWMLSHYSGIAPSSLRERLQIQGFRYWNLTRPHLSYRQPWLSSEGAGLSGEESAKWHSHTEPIYLLSFLTLTGFHVYVFLPSLIPLSTSGPWRWVELIWCIFHANIIKSHAHVTRYLKCINLESHN